MMTKEVFWVKKVFWQYIFTRVGVQENYRTYLCHLKLHIYTGITRHVLCGNLLSDYCPYNFWLDYIGIVNLRNASVLSVLMMQAEREC